MTASRESESPTSSLDSLNFVVWSFGFFLRGDGLRFLSFLFRPDEVFGGGVDLL